MRFAATALLLLVLAGGFAPRSALAQAVSNRFPSACQTAAASEPSAVRPGSPPTKMWCAFVDREGKLISINASDTGGTPQNPLGSDAWRGSIEIAIAKAYSALAFSSNDQALDTFTLGQLARQDGPGSTAPSDIGHDSGVAPLFGIGNTNPFRSTFGIGLGADDLVGGFHHGIVTFAGGQPVYRKGSDGRCTGPLIGGFGVSGDGVDQDNAVAKAAIGLAGFCFTR